MRNPDRFTYLHFERMGIFYSRDFIVDFVRSRSDVKRIQFCHLRASKKTPTCIYTQSNVNARIHAQHTYIYTHDTPLYSSAFATESKENKKKVLKQLVEQFV